MFSHHLSSVSLISRYMPLRHSRSRRRPKEGKKYNVYLRRYDIQGRVTEAILSNTCPAVIQHQKTPSYRWSGDSVPFHRNLSSHCSDSAGAPASSKLHIYDASRLRARRLNLFCALVKSPSTTSHSASASRSLSSAVADCSMRTRSRISDICMWMPQSIFGTAITHVWTMGPDGRWVGHSDRAHDTYMRVPDPSSR